MQKTALNEFVIKHGSSIYKAMLSLIYMGMLLLSYKFIAQPNYAYMGYQYFEPNILLLICNCLCIAFVSTQAPDKIKKPSDLFIWFFLIVVIIPSAAIPLVSVNEVDPYTLLLAQLIFSISFLAVIWIANSDIHLSDLPALDTKLFYIVLLGFFSLITFFVFYDFGFNPGRLFSLQSLAELYGIRLEQREALAGATLVSIYGTSWLTKLIIPMLIVICLRKKLYFFACCFVFAQLMVFTVSVQKSFIITLIITYFIYWLMNSGGDSGVRFFKAVSLFTLVAFMIFIVTGNWLLVDVLVRRALIVPGMLSGYYIEYFNINGFALYSQNFLSSVVETKYTTAPAYVIGQEYFGRPDLRANVNFLADSYGNIGGLGVLFNSIVLGVILLCFNVLSKGKDLKVIIPSLCGVAWSFSESPFVTSLFTHGVVFALLIVAIIPKQDLSNNKE